MVILWMYINKSIYYCPWINISMIIIGCLLVFTIGSNWTKNISKLLVFIGRNTLVLYIFHYDTLFFFERISVKLGIQINNWFGVILKFGWSLLICSVIALILNRYMPILVGKAHFKSNRIRR